MITRYLFFHSQTGRQRRGVNDPNFKDFVKEFRELQDRKEGLQIQIHNEVMIWKSKARRGFCQQDSRKKVFDLLYQFRFIHDELDVVLDREKISLESAMRHSLSNKTKVLKPSFDNETDNKIGISVTENSDLMEVDNEADSTEELLHPASVTASHPSVTALHPSVVAPQPSVTALNPSITAQHPCDTVTQPSVTALHPSITARHPCVTVPQSGVTALYPSITAPHPSVTAPQPGVTAPHPIVTAPHPSVTIQHPSVTAQHPSVTVPQPSVTAPNLGVTALHPSVTARLQCFRRANEQHTLILFRVLLDLEECKQIINQ